MKTLELNETPVRTSNNFNINNIALDEFEFPTIKEFDNVFIEKTNSNISDKCSKVKFTYGVGKIIEKSINESSNNNLKINIQENDIIKIEYLFDDDNLNLVNNIEIVAEGKSTIYILYKSETDKVCFHNGAIRLKADTESSIDIVLINLLNKKSINLESIENTLNESSRVNYTIVDFGAKTSISNYYSNIIGDNAINDLKTIYIGLKDQIKDFNYIAHLKGEKSNIDIDVQGALNGNAKKNFKGTIDFKKGCKKSIGNENEYCVLLSDKAKSIALPMLLCTEEDVVGNHSTASGKVNKNSLFYIMSRGFSYKEAVKLIIRANFNKIIDRIQDEEIKQIVIDELEKRI